jgi:hypothetical protein
MKDSSQPTNIVSFLKMQFRRVRETGGSDEQPILRRYLELERQRKRERAEERALLRDSDSQSTAQRSSTNEAS